MLEHTEPDHFESPFFLAGLEISPVESLFRPATRPPLRDILLGAGGSALSHMLVLIAVLLLPVIHPPRELQRSFVTVSLVEMGAAGGLSGGPGSGEDSAQGKASEEPSPAEKRPEPPPPPEPPKVAPRVESTAPVEKASKKPRPAPVPKQSPSPAPPATDSREAIPPSAQEPASPPSAPAGAGLAASGSKGGEGDGAGMGSARGAGGGSGHGSGTHGGEFESAAVDQIPQVIRKTEPDYPPRARRLGVSGKVVVRFLVGIDGRVSRPAIIEAQPQGYFEESALAAIVHWHFKPGYYQGKAVPTWVILPIHFKLTGR